MKLRETLMCGLLAVAAVGCGSEIEAGRRPYYHTSPDRWERPRVFHAPFIPRFEDHILISRVALASVPDDRQLSPNRAYWFALSEPDTAQPGPRFTNVDVFNERDQLVRTRLQDCRGLGASPRWINEKLLFVQVWWGRVLGTSMIYDVEAEQIIHREMVHGGTIPFQQYRLAAQRSR